MDLMIQVSIDGLPKYLLLLMSELNSRIVYPTTAKIVYVGDATGISHPVPFEEPVIGKSLPLDV